MYAFKTYVILSATNMMMSQMLDDAKPMIIECTIKPQFQLSVGEFIPLVEDIILYLFNLFHYIVIIHIGHLFCEHTWLLLRIEEYIFISYKGMTFNSAFLPLPSP